MKHPCKTCKHYQGKEVGRELALDGVSTVNESWIKCAMIGFIHAYMPRHEYKCTCKAWVPIITYPTGGTEPETIHNGGRK